MRQFFLIVTIFLISSFVVFSIPENNFKLLRCEQKSSQNFSVIQVPVSFINSSGGIEYSLKNLSVIQENRATPCNQFYKWLTPISKIKSLPDNVWRHAVLLLDNGYLSVANKADASIDYFASDEFCIINIHLEGENRTAYIRVCQPSKDRPVLNKCCPLGTILGANGCAKGPVEWEPSYLDLKTLTHKSPQEIHPVYHSPKLDCHPESEMWVQDGCQTEFYPLKTGKTGFIGRFRSWEILEQPPGSQYCYDRHETEDNFFTNVLFMCNGNETDLEQDLENVKSVSYLYMIGMYIGAIFHFLTSLVYLITWSKQNIYGRTLCSCTVALFFMQIFLGTAHLLGIIGDEETRESTYCFLNGVAAHFFFIAAFTWLLILNINLWLTFRSPFGIGAGESRVSERKRFLIYSGVGWGFPLLVTGISVLLDLSYKCRTSRIPTPEYGVNTCFIATWSQGYYVYYILAVLMGITLVFAALTLTALFSYQKATSNVGASRRAENMRTFLLFLKLSVVMGLTWVFEVVSWALTKEDEAYSWFWLIFDMYNVLSAILIFIIFVCQQNTLNLLQQVHPAFNVLHMETVDYCPTFRRKDSLTVGTTTGVRVE
ncbi:unnamed protein product [Orchesella dallaii]|uniref:G-protein coupled receptors family 2 profile 2 domain-containing protein n=1 Tax=Orchesella dallaii TaxID=48710 RepID=A0ABP1S816_9HEXA